MSLTSKSLSVLNAIYIQKWKMSLKHDLIVPRKSSFAVMILQEVNKNSNLLHFNDVIVESEVSIFFDIVVGKLFRIIRVHFYLLV